MNQFSLNLQPSDTLWYTPMEHHHHHQQPPQQKSYPFFYQNYDDADSDNSSSNANNADRSETTSSTTTATLDKEHMFEKPLTPSDVGKLNRLVIPKQHAEKYFPLAAATAAAANDSTTVAGGSGTGGLLLGFEDEAGKCWRFRYSYWNSSQSYVLTKGWSRYVKEKKLDAGDVVLFERHRFDSDRFFIGWRRRGSNPPVQPSAGWTARSSSSSYNFNQNHGNYHQNQNVVQSQQNYAASHQISAFPNYPHHHPESPHAGTVQVRQKAKKSGGVNSKRVRLFGVNLECELEDEDQQVVDDEPSPQTSDGSSLSSQGGQGHGLGSNSATMGHHTTSYNYFDYMGYPQHNHMDMNFSTR